MKLNSTNLIDLFLKFVLKNFKITVIIFILPQILYFIYDLTRENKNCIATTKVIVSKSILNKSIIDEVFTDYLEIDKTKDINIFGTNIVIKGSDIKDCTEKYNLLQERTKDGNKNIEEFYMTQLTPLEKSRFAGPILFNTIGDKKIQFAKLTDLDFDTYKNERSTKNRIYIFVLSIIVLMSLFFARNIKIK